MSCSGDQDGGGLTSCLLDTGSQVSTLSEGFFWNNLGRKDGDMLSTSGWLKLTAANGLDIPYLGCLELVVETMGMTVPDCGFLVVKDPQSLQMSVPGIMAMNIINRCRQLVHAEFEITLGGELDWDWKNVFQQVQKCKVNKKAMARLADKKKVYIPVASMVTVRECDQNCDLVDQIPVTISS